ncbi:MAG: CARDB domain-containing protein [Patescibacteria group bacterium]
MPLWTSVGGNFSNSYPPGGIVSTSDNFWPIRTNYWIEALNNNGDLVSDRISFGVNCPIAGPPPPPPNCPGGASKNCSGTQQNQFRCTTGLSREQCRSTTGRWCWEAASSCSAGQSCSGGSCVTPPPPLPPPPGPSCNARTFARPPSGFYNTAGASITSIARNTTFDILCNYTVGTNDTGIIPVTAGAPNCGWIDFVGTSARFRCNGGIATAGTYTYECKVGPSALPLDNSCFQDNPIGSITITGGATPPPPPPPPPPAPGCSNTWNSTSGGTYDKDGLGTQCGCDSWDRCGNYNGPFSPSPDPWCSPRPGGCPLPPPLPPPPPPPPPSAGRSDLEVTNYWTDPATILSGNLVDFAAIVRNQPSATAAPGVITQTSLCLDVGSSTIGVCDVNINRNTSSLSPGTSEQESWVDVWTAVAGTHTYRICADAGSAVTELNESNNCVTSTFTVGTVPPPPPPSACTHSVYPSNKFHVCYFDTTAAPTGADPILRQEDESLIAATPTTLVGALPSVIDHDWGTGAVGGTTEINTVSGVWRGEINLRPGIYTFHVTSDDGVKFAVGIGGTMTNVINEWQDQNLVDRASEPVTLPGGPTRMRLRWYEDGGGARIKLWWTFTPGGDPPPPPPPPPCDTVGAACCGNTCGGGLVCDEDLNICINPEGDLPTVTLEAPDENEIVNTARSTVPFDGSSASVMPVTFRWEFADDAGGTQSHYRLYVGDITDEFDSNGDDLDSDSGCVVDGDYSLSIECAKYTADFSSSLGGEPFNGKAIASPADDRSRTVNLRVNRKYVWTVAGRSSQGDPLQPPAFDERRSDILVTGYRVFDTGAGIISGGDIYIKRIDRNGNLFTEITDAFIGTDTEGQQRNPARFEGLNPGNSDFPTAAFTTPVNGYTLFAGVCRYARLTIPCDPATFTRMTYSVPWLAYFIDGIDIVNNEITHVVIKYLPQCSDGLDNDDPDGDVDEDDAGCHVDGDPTKPYDPNDTNEGDEPVGPGGDFTITHIPLQCDHISSDDLTCISGKPWHPHHFADLRFGTFQLSNEIVVKIQSVAGFAGIVTLNIGGMSLDHSPVYDPGDANADGLPDNMGDGEADDLSYPLSTGSKVTPVLDGTNRFSLPVIISADGVSEVRLKLRRVNIPPNRYVMKVTGSATINGVTVTKPDPLLVVVGEGTSGYQER